MKQIKFRHSTPGVKIIYIFFFIFFLLFAFLYIYPLIWSFINSLKSMKEYATNSLSLPDKWLWHHYLDVFTEFKAIPLSGGEPLRFFDMLFNSLWMLFLKVFVNVCSSMLLAYALARFRFPGSKVLYAIVIFANVIPIIGTGPAAYRLAMQLDLVNNPKLIWIMWASGFDFAFIVLYGYFKGVSSAYSESAKIDGANNWIIFIKIMLPQVIPCIAAIAITQATGVWNDYSTPMIYMRNYPNLAYGLYLFKDSAFLVKDSMPIYFAAAVISCLPVIILYSCTQNFILTNMTTGGLKG